MQKIFGYVVGGIWLVFVAWAFRTSQAGWAEGYADLGFWWTVIATLYLIAGGSALIGTARHRYTGPRK